MMISERKNKTQKRFAKSLNKRITIYFIKFIIILRQYQFIFFIHNKQPKCGSIIAYKTSNIEPCILNIDAYSMIVNAVEIIIYMIRFETTLEKSFKDFENI